MKTTMILVVIMAVISVQSVMAENDKSMMAPPGPYRSIGDVDQYKIGQNVQNGLQLRENNEYSPAQSDQQVRGVPEWERQRQMQMENWMKQSNMPQVQSRNNKPQHWNYNRYPSMQNTYSSQMPSYQNNRMSQPFPSARGPVYGPGIPPVEFYNNQLQPRSRY